MERSRLNGTRVRDRSLKKGDVEEVVPGEAFELGKVMCIVQRRAVADLKPRRGLKPHSYIETRLEEIWMEVQGDVQSPVAA